MFTVKATYRGETRKMTFSQSSFPSFDQLYNQLFRVFPLSHNYYLSKLLFSPNATNARILIAREVHNAQEYQECLSQFTGHTFPNALLRFSVMDEMLHKAPASVSRPFTDNFPSVSTIPPPVIPFNPQTYPPIISAGHIPPPPIIFSHLPSKPPIINSPSRPYLFPTRQEPQCPAAAVTSCCAVAQGKAEVESMIRKFKEDLDAVLLRTFGSTLGSTSSPSALPAMSNPSFADLQVQPPAAPAMPFCLFKVCMPCGKVFQGPWYTCECCGTVYCPNCNEENMFSSCRTTGNRHIMKREKCAACPADRSQSPGFVPSAPGSAEAQTPLSMSPGLLLTPNNVPVPTWVAPTSWSLPQPMAMPPAPMPPVPIPTAPIIPASPAPMPSPMPSMQEQPMASNDVSMSSQVLFPGTSVVHSGIICDVCRKTIEGVRHKCLDCPDYDLCTACISSGAAENHNPFHEFLEIHEPGRVIVHTINNGAETQRRSAPPDPEPNYESVAHDATCNLCDSRIRGTRYKCLDCPDFDTCSSCFSITGEQHPGHSFARIKNPADYLRRLQLDQSAHFATCNVCVKRIYGVRYKCMHPECPDYDLCQTCEAHPIAVHPSTHPLLKMKSSETVIPTVYRVGQTTLIEQTTEPSPVPPQRPLPGSFGQGYMLNPSRSPSSNRSPIIPPPSPFFYQTETPRPDSPVVAQEAPNVSMRASPPLAIPGSLSALMGYGTQSGHSSVPPPAPVSAPRWGFAPPPSSGPTPWPLPPINVANQRSFSGSKEPDFRDVQQPNISPSWMERRLPFEPQFRIVPFPSRSPSPIPSVGRFPAVGESSQPGSPTWRLPPVLPPLRQDNDLSTVDESTSLPGMESLLDAFNRSLDLPPLTPPAPPEVHPVQEVRSSRDTSDDPKSLWPKMADFRHLRKHSSSLVSETPVDRRSPLSLTAAETLPDLSTAFQDPQIPAIESPLTNEALLSRPASLSHEEEAGSKPIGRRSSLQDLLSGFEDPISLPTPSPVADVINAEFAADVTVPDGQNFPPGAEFMKCWRMINTGTKEWPATTELIYVAGDDLSKNKPAKAVVVGAVQPGSKVDLWTGELKAPDAPGKYVSYWRLRDSAKGTLFGDNIWFDIVVAEPNNRSSQSTESSLTSSSLIVMPQLASGVSGNHQGNDSSGATSPVTVFSVPTTAITEETDAVSDAGSESSISLVSVPDSDEEIWEDSRVYAPVANEEQATEYIVLYDESSSEEE